MAGHHYRRGGFNADKYYIRKRNGRPLDPCAKYFLLRYDCDPYAREALITYIKMIQVVNPKFAGDLWKEILDTNEDFVKHQIALGMGMEGKDDE